MAESSDKLECSKMSPAKDRRPSVESLKRASAVISKRKSSGSDQVDITQEQTTDNPKQMGEPPKSYVHSKLNRQGSRQYRNEGWRSSQKKLVKTDSDSSIKSSVSDKAQAEASTTDTQMVCPEISPEEDKVSVHQKFADIASILQDIGVDDSLLQKIGN